MRQHVYERNTLVSLRTFAKWQQYFEFHNTATAFTTQTNLQTRTLHSTFLTACTQKFSLRYKTQLTLNFPDIWLALKFSVYNIKKQNNFLK